MRTISAITGFVRNKISRHGLFQADDAAIFDSLLLRYSSIEQVCVACIRHERCLS